MVTNMDETFMPVAQEPKINALTRDLYSTKYLNLRSWMKLPTFRVSQRGTCHFNASLSLFLSFKLNGGDPDKKMVYREMKTASFTISPYNIARVTEFFRQIAGWFDRGAAKEIFERRADDNSLQVSADFVSYNVTLIDDRRTNSTQAIKAQPAVYYDKGRDEGEMGCAISINMNDYTGIIPYYDVKTLYFIFKDFSFQEESYLLLTMLTHNDVMVQDKNDYGDFVERQNPFTPADHPVMF